MAYTKHNWESGEIITAAKLNNIEEGIEAILNGGGSGGGGGTPQMISFYHEDNENLEYPHAESLFEEEEIQEIIDKLELGWIPVVTVHFTDPSTGGYYFDNIPMKSFFYNDLNMFSLTGIYPVSEYQGFFSAWNSVFVIINANSGDPDPLTIRFINTQISDQELITTPMDSYAQDICIDLIEAEYSPNESSDEDEGSTAK